ncbi:murein L,D-transpeptidase catalytic domain family protein [Niabella sp. CC-SYL272]|uniref:murein L,D-transpeptidase catalytic domain family protein n=1 Tax=Niabella agricola TaxID=2891571 RepID=UPI001F2A48B8|nr:murein L,D-transpeptidase catalytic domain family protein [Niabella agricola]MCF3108687.1 murein L,D-transpeptidase catalytic domain family protein [Niabella agricola]
MTNISWRAPAMLPVSAEISSVPMYRMTFGLTVNSHQLIYDSLHLDLKGLSEKAFTYALEGLEELKEEGKVLNDSVITIVDFDQPSVNKRMYILDVKNYKLLFNTWAAHGRKSGTLVATSFSNTLSSNKSSLGFYLTDEPYYGGNGYSLKLKGLEPGLNDRAMQRAIVLHGARYVSQESIQELGYLGRSFGCPAVPVELSQPIIETIKEGSILFIYNSSYRPRLFLAGS